MNGQYGRFPRYGHICIKPIGSTNHNDMILSTLAVQDDNATDSKSSENSGGGGLCGISRISSVNSRCQWS